MKQFFKKIHDTTAHMGRRQKAEYILTYYWYHMLGVLAAAGLTIFIIVHFAFAPDPPAFTCVLVNQAIDWQRDAQVAEAFSGDSGIETDLIVIDSDYNISYPGHELKGINESSYEKFFFKWANHEIEAAVMPESFLKYCSSLGGVYREMDEFDTGSLELFKSGGEAVGIMAEKTRLADYMVNETGEPLILVFPVEGKNQENCQTFIDFIQTDSSEERVVHNDEIKD